jgi:hypothetical protein
MPGFKCGNTGIGRASREGGLAGAAPANNKNFQFETSGKQVAGILDFYQGSPPQASL